MRRRLTGLCFSGLLTATQPMLAQDVDAVAEAPPRYLVEVIVFAYNEADVTEELFTHRPRARIEPEARRQPLVVSAAEAADAGLESARRLAGEELIVLDGLTLEELTWAPADAARDDPGDNTAVAALDTPALPPPFPGEAIFEPDPGARADPDSLLPGTDEARLAELDHSVRILQDGQLRAFRFRLLRPDELELGAAYDRLDRLSAYRPLVHGGWVQEGLPEEQAAAFNLAYLGVANPTGTIKLHLSRFLHLTVDLDYRPEAQDHLGLGAPSSFALGELELQPRYKISTQRRARSGELHYIDHPLFGVLLLVTPEPESEEQDSELSSTPAA